MTEPLETSELLAFTKTVDSKSLSRAALELGSPRATISRRLARLEERLGVRLLRRTTRSLTLTEAGESFYRQARLALAAVEHARQSVHPNASTLRGDLRVSVPPFASDSFRKLVCDFVEREPQVRLHLNLSTHYVDLRREGYDLALRAARELEPGLTARSLLRDALWLVAAPSYLASHGTPTSTRKLREHRCLLGFARGELPQTYWPLASGGKLHVDGAFSTNDVSTLREAALRGLGLALLPRMMIREELATGTLVQVLAGVVEAPSSLSLVYPERAYVPPHVRAFIEAIVAWAATDLAKEAFAAVNPRTASGARPTRPKPAPARPKPAKRTNPRAAKANATRTRPHASRAEAAAKRAVQPSKKKRGGS